MARTPSGVAGPPASMRRFRWRRSGQSADPVMQPLLSRREAWFNKHARVLSVVHTKVTDGLVTRAVVPRLRRLHGWPFGYEHSQDVSPLQGLRTACTPRGA